MSVDMPPYCVKSDLILPENASQSREEKTFKKCGIKIVCSREISLKISEMQMDAGLGYGCKGVKGSYTYRVTAARVTELVCGDLPTKALLFNGYLKGDN